MYLIYFALSTSSFTVLILLNILYSSLLSGSGNKEKMTGLEPPLLHSERRLTDCMNKGL